MIRVLVTGSRETAPGQWAVVKGTLDLYHGKYVVDVLVQGGAPGYDALAKTWALSNSITLITDPAKWRLFGRKAGTIRNQRMLGWLSAERGDRVIAFPPGPAGTFNMIGHAQNAGLPVDRVGWTEDDYMRENDYRSRGFPVPEKGD